ncbi:hypothetical protein D3C84_330030 [compost metagenome]
MQHLLRRLIQGGQLLRQGPGIARNQQADLLALLTQGLGQRFSSALPGLGQQRPALWRCLAPRAHRARRFIGQQQVTATGSARQGFKGVCQGQAVALHFMLPELRTLLA